MSVESRLGAVHFLVQEQWGAIEGFREGEEGSFRKGTGTMAVVAQGGLGFFQARDWINTKKSELESLKQ